MSITIGIISSSRPKLLLDVYTGAAAAYSLRKLRTSYTGAAIRVRRSSDNAEIDVGFSNDVLDTTTLLAFCGASNGFVRVWYDQSGNPNNVSQTITTQQPLIVSAGVLNFSNGKPAIFFNRTNQNRLVGSGLISGNIARSQIAVYQATSIHTAAEGGVFGQGSDAVVGSWSSIQNRSTLGAVGSPYFAGYGADLGNGLTTEDTIMKIGSFFYNSITGYLWKNNTQLTSGSLTLNTSILYATQIGDIGGGIGVPRTPLAGNISECILYLNNQLANATGINSNINSYYSIY